MRIPPADRQQVARVLSAPLPPSRQIILSVVTLMAWLTMAFVAIRVY